MVLNETWFYIIFGIFISYFALKVFQKRGGKSRIHHRGLILVLYGYMYDSTLIYHVFFSHETTNESMNVTLLFFRKYERDDSTFFPHFSDRRLSKMGKDRSYIRDWSPRIWPRYQKIQQIAVFLLVRFFAKLAISEVQIGRRQWYMLFIVSAWFDWGLFFVYDRWYMYWAFRCKPILLRKPWPLLIELPPLITTVF